MTEPDTASLSADRSADIACIASRERTVVIRWGDGHESEFHHVWLRDNCRCDACGKPDSQERLINFLDLSTDVTPRDVTVDDHDNIVIVWSGDDHRSTYSARWLRAHCYARDERSRRRLKPVLWDGRLAGGLPEIDYRTARAGPRGQLDLLHRLRDYGFVLVHDVPTDPDEVLSVARLVGFPRETYYGQIFDIFSTADGNLLSGTTSFIHPHTDEGWRAVPVGIILFHCLEAGSAGGDTVLLDGFRIAEELRWTDPRAFDLLTRVPLRFHRHNPGEYNLHYDSRVISVDQDGNVVGFRFPFRFRAPLDIPGELVEPTYEAIKSLTRLLTREDFRVQFTLRPGSVLLFDNHRLLHGRTKYSGRRHFRYCYVDRDDFHNRLRLLGEQLGQDDAELTLPRGALA